MSKHKKHRNHVESAPQPGPRPPVPISPPAPTVPGSGPLPPANALAVLADKAEKLLQKGTEGATEADLKQVVGAPPAGLDLAAVVAKAHQAWQLFQTREAGARKREEEAGRFRESLDRREQGLNEREKRISADAEALRQGQKKLADDFEHLKAQTADLLAREEKIRKRELDAEAGFAGLRRELLGKLDQEAQTLREEMARLGAQAVEERLRLQKEAEEARDKLNTELDGRRHACATDLERTRAAVEEEILKGRATLNTERAALRKAKQEIDVDRELLAEDRVAFATRVERRAAALLEELRAQIKDMEERLGVARRDRDALTEKLQQRDEADRRFGQRTPEEVLGDIARLTDERDRLRATLDSRPTAVDAERLRSLEREQEKWETDRQGILQENEALKRQLGRCSIAVTEVETLRDQKAALESSQGLLRAALEELRKDVTERISRADEKHLFPACSKMDDDEELQAQVDVEERIPDLEAFAADLQNRIAFNPDPGKRLYYSPRDVRVFLGGLAMSRLHLLQGISGTGKTSLPIAFASAIDAGLTLVEVQAGWRDRQDLIGNFNAFERLFYESEFLQALYRARCPFYEGRPYVVLLDEMNLSHPEQYFADLLSALEQQPELQKLDLMTAPVDPAPRFLENGRTLRIPQNVWFIGTANHDETTKDFADKTYDRAHVMELPRHREVFVPRNPNPRAPIGLEALKTAFAAAKRRNGQAAQMAYQFLDEHLAEVLKGRFRVGWGNRLERQMADFVPVVIEAGGSVGEATDHILATKLLRKVRDRHDTRPDDLVALREALLQAWPQLDPDDPPARSLDIISEEMHRLGVDAD